MMLDYNTILHRITDYGDLITEHEAFAAQKDGAEKNFHKQAASGYREQFENYMYLLDLAEPLRHLRPETQHYINLHRFRLDIERLVFEIDSEHPLHDHPSDMLQGDLAEAVGTYMKHYKEELPLDDEQYHSNLPF